MTPLVWIAIVLMVMGAVMLIAGIGAPGLWIAVVTVAIALVVIDRTRRRHRLVPRTRNLPRNQHAAGVHHLPALPRPGGKPCVGIQGRLRLPPLAPGPKVSEERGRVVTSIT